MDKTSSETSSSELSTRTPIATADATAAAAEEEGALDFGGWWKLGRQAAAEAVADALPNAMSTPGCEAYVDDALQLEAHLEHRRPLARVINEEASMEPTFGGGVPGGPGAPRCALNC